MIQPEADRLPSGSDFGTSHPDAGHLRSAEPRALAVASIAVFVTLMAMATLQTAEARQVIALPFAILISGVLLAVLWVRDRRARQREIETQAELEVLKRAALVDSLTGLGNHRAFEEELLAVLARGAGSKFPFCLLVLDMHGLKETNDTLGHQAGDERIRAVARALRAVVGGDASAHRIGGDEFAVVLSETHGWAGFEVAQRLSDQLGKAPGAEVNVGIAETGAPEPKDGLIARADLALLAAKRLSRLAVIYTPDLEPDPTEPEPAQGEPHHRAILASALARAVDAKDPYTRSHSETVSTLCVLIANELGFEPKRVSKLRMAGLLHDVGKVGTPDEILNKPARLTAEESAVVQAHAELGASIARAAELTEEARWILHHHERIDGGGYPAGLGGETIPLESRIILVADAYEALISDRPYRAGRPSREALAEIERHAGTQFDSNCVAVLRAALHSNGGPPKDEEPASEAFRLEVAGERTDLASNEPALRA